MSWKLRSFVHPVGQITRGSLHTTAFIAIIFFAAFAHADLNRGGIVVTVREPLGALYPNTTVRLADEAGKATTSPQTDAEGKVEVGNLDPGVYVISIDSVFAPYSKIVKLQPGETINMEVTLRFPPLQQSRPLTAAFLLRGYPAAVVVGAGRSAPLLHFKPKREAKSYDSLVDANRRFAFKFFHQAVTRHAEKNVLIAPVSLSFDFALLQNGADDAARRQINDVFQWNELSPEQINQQSLDLRQALTYRQEPSPEEISPLVMPARSKRARKGPETEADEYLRLTTSLWTGDDVAFRPHFLEANEQFYSADTEALPRNKKLAMQKIGRWVAQQTGSRFPEAASAIQSADFLMLSTTWFKGVWANPFLRENTHPRDFTLLSGIKKKVPIMAEGGNFFYLQAPQFQAIALDYSHATMYVFLPSDDSNLKALEESLTPENWALWMAQINSQKGVVELPRFESQETIAAASLLQDLGAVSLFNSIESFAPAVMNPGGAKLTSVLQKVLLNVDEKGTEVQSFGITAGVIGGVGGEPHPEPFRMLINRPFFFAICDQQSGAILYMGAIVDPSAGS